MDWSGAALFKEKHHRSRSRGHEHKQRRRGHRAPAFAAIDLGTNSCRMLIARPSDGGFTVIDGFSRIVRLGAGLVRSGSLQDDAMDRTLTALDVCRQKIEHHAAAQVRCVATAACRQADNGDEFIGRILTRTGLAVEAITPLEEATLTLAGCSPLLRSGYTRGILFDIGGGSTEIMWLDIPHHGAPVVRDMVSMPMGVVTLVDEFGRGRLDRDTFEEIVTRADDRLKDFDSNNGISDAVGDGLVQMIGTSGTMTTLGALHLGLPRYDRARIDGLSLDLVHVRSLAARISEMDYRRRQELPCIGRGRADLMVMGCALLSAIIRRWPAAAVRIADRGIREGLIAEMIEANRNPDVAQSVAPAA